MAVVPAVRVTVAVQAVVADLRSAHAALVAQVSLLTRQYHALAHDLTQTRTERDMAQESLLRERVEKKAAVKDATQHQVDRDVAQAQHKAANEDRDLLNIALIRTQKERDEARGRLVQAISDHAKTVKRLQWHEAQSAKVDPFYGEAPDTATARLVQCYKSLDGSGEWKRGQVLAKLVDRYPELRRRELAMMIERAVEQDG